MLLPILCRLWQRQETDPETPSFVPSFRPSTTSAITSSSTPPLTSEQSVVVTSGMSYDTPNTYLDAGARDLPERQCTLCLEPRGVGEGSGGTVAVTECGHVFCWGCLGGLEKVSLPKFTPRA